MLKDVTEGADRPRLKPGYNVWFGLQHVTLTGFRHAGCRENCPKCVLVEPLGDAPQVHDTSD